MSSLAEHKLYYEDLTPKPERVGKDSQMSKAPTTNEAPKVSRKYAKTRGEHLKDMVIVALVAGLIAFISGMHFSNQQHAATAQAVKAAQVTATADVKK